MYLRLSLKRSSSTTIAHARVRESLVRCSLFRFQGSLKPDLKQTAVIIWYNLDVAQSESEEQYRRTYYLGTRAHRQPFATTNEHAGACHVTHSMCRRKVVIARRVQATSSSWLLNLRRAEGVWFAWPRRRTPLILVQSMKSA